MNIRCVMSKRSRAFRPVDKSRGQNAKQVTCGSDDPLNQIVLHHLIFYLCHKQRWSHGGVNGVARPLGSHGNNLRGPLELLVRPLGAAHHMFDGMSERRKQPCRLKKKEAPRAGLFF